MTLTFKIKIIAKISLYVTRARFLNINFYNIIYRNSIMNTFTIADLLSRWYFIIVIKCKEKSHD